MKLKRITGVIVILVMLLACPSVAHAADTDIAPLACPEIGHHQNVTNHTSFFMAGSLGKFWVSPGVTYTGNASHSTTVTGTVYGGADAEFLNFVRANVAGSLATSHTVKESATLSWTNTSNTTKWVQLGVRGHEFDYSRYDIVAHCQRPDLLVRYGCRYSRYGETGRFAERGDV